MKDWIKYLISAVTFGIVYVAMEYIFTRNIEWKTIIVTTIIYGILNAILNIVAKKKTTKK